MSPESSPSEMSFMQHHPGPILIVDLQGDLRYLNPSSEKFLKKSGRDAAQFGEILPPDFLDIIHNCKAAEVGIPVTRMEYPERVLLWTAYFGETMEEVVYQGVDITRLHRNEIALRAAKEKAEEGEKLKAAFLDNMSHEIRTPLNSLLGFMGLLSEELEGSLNADQVFYFDLIQKNGDRLARTMQEILDISHFSTGTYEVKKESVDIVDILQLQIEAKTDEAEVKGLEVRQEIPDHQLFAHTDEYCLRQTLAHLIDNAIKYTDTGHILVKVSQAENSIQINIEDSGPGMDDEMQRRIFVAFNQGSLGHSKQYQGIGLGLSLVRVYLDTIGATVDLDSNLGEGSRFQIQIPI